MWRFAPPCCNTIWMWLGCAMSFTLTGCVQDRYHFGIKNQELALSRPRTPNLITMGGEHPNVDTVERVVHYPGKVFRKWFPDKDPESQIPIETRRLRAVQTATDYLDDNGIQGVYVDVREYNPREQWNRLTNNRNVAPFWKYTGGTLYHLGYSVFPARAFGFDQYNPFTNTLSINSASPAESVFQAGYVKKIYDQRYPGSYVAMNWLPVFPLVRDVGISNDVLTYARVKQNWPLEKKLLPQVYGHLGGDAVGQSLTLIPGTSQLPFYATPLLTGLGSAAGSVTGNAIVKQQEEIAQSRLFR